MKLEIITRVLSDEGELLGENSRSLSGISEEFDINCAAGLKAEEYNLLNAEIEKLLIEKKLKNAFLK